MRPLVYTNLVYIVLFCVTQVLWGISEGLWPFLWKRGKNVQKREARSTVVLWSCYLLGIAGYYLWPLLGRGTTITTHPAVVFFVGMGLVFFGIGVRWWAIWTLGSYFSSVLIVTNGHQVIQHGPYRLVRHPSYTGLAIITLGIGLMMTDWASACFLLCGFLIGLWYRIKSEEEVLRLSLGTPYTEYMQVVSKRLIPFVW